MEVWLADCGFSLFLSLCLSSAYTKAICDSWWPYWTPTVDSLQWLQGHAVSQPISCG